MADRAFTVFYSWQSDSRAAANRTLIANALQGAVDALTEETSVVEAVRMEQDTTGLLGSPPIAESILARIRSAGAVVCDVTPALRTQQRGPVPNPNVLVELGYALASLGEANVLLVLNTAFGAPEQLPFDLRHRRVIRYDNAEDATDRSQAKKGLQGQLLTALRPLVESRSAEAKRPEFTLELTWRTLNRVPNKAGEIIRHDYEATARLVNAGERTVRDWHVEIELPKVLQQPHVTLGALVSNRSTATTLLLRRTPVGRHKELFPGDEVVMTVPYMVDEERYERGVVGQSVSFVARAFVEGVKVAEVRRPVADMQNF